MERVLAFLTLAASLVACGPSDRGLQARYRFVDDSPVALERGEAPTAVIHDDTRRVLQGHPGGLALRFARLKAYRSDKGPGDADTIATVRDIYYKQTGERPDGGERQLSLLPE